MIKQISYIFLFILIASCGGEGKKKVKKPNNLISKEKMVNIIYDMSLISAAKGVNRKLMEQKGVHPEKYVYEKYGIDSTQFAQSNEYYAFDVDAYEEIYKNVKTKLTKDKKVYTDLVQVEDNERDSINKERRKLRDSLKQQEDFISEELGDKRPLGIDRSKLKPARRLKNVDSLKKSRNRQN